MCCKQLAKTFSSKCPASEYYVLTVVLLLNLSVVLDDTYCTSAVGSDGCVGMSLCTSCSVLYTVCLLGNMSVNCGMGHFSTIVVPTY